jgi:ankyrin repeat protein
MPTVVRSENAETALERSSDIVVMVEGSLGFGAGLIFGQSEKRIYIATANHVVRRGQEASDLRVKLRFAPEEWIPAFLTDEYDPSSDLDLAVLTVRKADLKPFDFCTLPLLRLGDLDGLKRGVEVYPLGYPNGAQWGLPVQPDKISQIVGRMITFQSAFISTGHSGGVLLDSEGHIAGLIIKDSPPFGVSVVINSVVEQLRRWDLPLQLRRPAATTPIHTAVKTGTLTSRLLGELLSDCWPIDAGDERGRRPLHLAAAMDFVSAAALLLDRGASPDAQTVFRSTPLHLAAYHGARRLADLLLARGADVNAADLGGFSPLHYAAMRNHREIAESLLRGGARVNRQAGASGGLPGYEGRLIQMEARELGLGDKTYSGYTPLQAAAATGAMETARLLLQSGADVNPKPGPAPLVLAQRAGHNEVVKLLIEQGADIPYDFLHDVLLAEQLDLGDFLIGKGLEVDEELMLEVLSGQRLASAQFLLDLGAEIRAGTLQQLAYTGNVPAVEFLIDRAGFDADQRANTIIIPGSPSQTCPVFTFDYIVDKEDIRPIYCAAAGGSIEVMRLLIEKGASLTGTGAVHAAARANQPESIQFLVEAGVEVNEPAPGANPFFGRLEQSPLHLAAKAGNVQAVEALLALGADIDASDRQGNTPLHLAVIEEKVVLVGFLVEKGANTRVNNVSGKRPADLTTRQDILDLLKSERR